MRRTPEEIKTCVEDLLSRMTLEEKIGQMVQSAGADTTAIGGEVKTSPLEGLIAEGKIGSIIYMPDSAAMARRLQRIAVEKSRLGIPLIFCQDVIHGFQTIFPIPLGWSCSFDPDLVRRATEISAREATRAGVMLAFAPMLDIARDPRWGRISEGAGEDPFLDACMARAEVLGYQGGEGGQGLGDGEHMACCLKHFVGYGAAEAGRDYNTVEISPSTLHNVYLPAFQAGVDAGAATVMPSFNLVDGVSSAASPYVLQELLRKELGFDGVIISVYAAVFEVIAHGLAADEREAAERCANAGLDIEMATDLFNRELPQLVMEGKVPESLVDDAVRRILTLKYRLGIMDDPYLYMHEGEEEAALRPRTWRSRAAWRRSPPSSSRTTARCRCARAQRSRWSAPAPTARTSWAPGSSPSARTAPPRCARAWRKRASPCCASPPRPSTRSSSAASTARSSSRASATSWSSPSART